MNKIDKTKLSDQIKFRLDEIRRIQNYFNSQINQRKLRRKKKSKYVSDFEYIDKIVIVLNATTGGVCIVSHATVVSAPVEIAGSRFTIVFSLAIGTIKKYIKSNKDKKKRHDKILMLAKSKLNNIETSISSTD